LFHLHLVILFQVLYLDERLVLEVGEALFPLVVELLQLGVSDLDVLSELSLLDVLAQLILVLHDVLLQLTHLPHQVLEHLVLQDVAQFLCQQLHLRLYQREYQYLLVLIQKTIFVHIEHLYEVW
jgi:hypothetical protein